MNPKGRPKGTKKSNLKHLSETLLKQLFAIIRKSKSIRDDLIFSLTLFLGLRVSELTNLKLSDIHTESYQLTIHGLKGGRNRTYDLDGKLWRKLQRWLKERKKLDPQERNPYLFPSKWYHDTPIAAQSVKELFKRYAKKAGLSSDYSIHSLRHTCGILRAKAKCTPIEIMLWLRHKSVTSTQVYFEQVQFEEDDLKAKETFAPYL